MKYFTKKIIAVLLTVMLTGITVLHVSRGQTIKVNAAQTFKVHFIDVGAADGALLQYGEGENAKYALIDSGAYSYETTDHDTIDVSDRVHQYLLDHGVKHLEFVVLTHPHGDHIGGMKKILEDKNITIDTIYGNPLEFEYLESSEDKEKQFIQRCIIAYPVCCATGRNIRKIRRSDNDLLWSVRQYLQVWKSTGCTKFKYKTGK